VSVFDPRHVKQGVILTDEQPSEPESLDARIAAAKAAQMRNEASAETRSENAGWAIGIEFVGAVLVSGFIGWLVDHYAGWHTSPWGMIILLVLGFAAGTRRAMQTSAQFDADVDDKKK
jgi:ATP synthase protein I